MIIIQVETSQMCKDRTNYAVVDARFPVGGGNPEEEGTDPHAGLSKEMYVEMKEPGPKGQERERGVAPKSANAVLCSLSIAAYKFSKELVKCMIIIILK